MAHTEQRGIPGAQFIDPKVLARLSNLELLAKTVVDGFIHGLHRAPDFGLSVDFAEHRAYMPGDDIRRVDWRLYARTDRYYVKEYEADTNTNFSVVLDISKSMTFAGRGISKLDYARYLAASLTYFTHKQRDRVGIVTFDSDIVDRVPPSAKHMNTVLYTLDRIQSTRAGNLTEPLHKIAEVFRRRSIIVVVSDFYEEPEVAVNALTPLAARGHDLIVFHVLDPAELDFPFGDASNFEDLETGARIPVVPDKLRDEYRKLITEHTMTLAKRLGELRIDYHLFNTATPLDHALFAYLSMRDRMSRTR